VELRVITESYRREKSQKGSETSESESSESRCPYMEGNDEKGNENVRIMTKHDRITNY
jgi:hypothetical protein